MNQNVKSETFFVNSRDEIQLFTEKWYPINGVKNKGVVQIAHGMGETTDYYREFCNALSNAGYFVYINEARGHGRTAGDINNPHYAENAGYLGENGIEAAVNDLKTVTDLIKMENQNLPVFLLGHSLGSILAQFYAYRFGKNVNGIIYSGTTGPISKDRVAALKETAEEEIKAVGKKAPSKKAAALFFEHFNDQFEPIKTPIDWMTSDEERLSDTLSSPYAAIEYKTLFYADLFSAFDEVWKDDNLKKIPKSLPILSISGDKDPFGENGEGIKRLFALYKSYGIPNVKYIIYPEGRHEMLREKNRVMVFEDVVAWLNEHSGLN